MGFHIKIVWSEKNERKRQQTTMTKEEETEEMTMGATMTTIQPNSETHAQRKRKTEREWAFVQVCVCVCVCASNYPFSAYKPISKIYTRKIAHNEIGWYYFLWEEIGVRRVQAKYMYAICVYIILRTSDGIVSMNIILNVNFLIYKAIFVEPFLRCINRQMLYTECHMSRVLQSAHIF